jgi:phosphonopyruvate decarboxylase
LLSPTWFLSELARHGVTHVTGVPCSYARGLYQTLEGGDWPYLSATSEGEAVALAAGTWLAGSQAVALCQNSGLGNMVNPLSSLTAPYRIPVILGVSRRGWPPGTDEPQHALMGEITPGLLSLLEIPAQPLSEREPDAAAQLSAAARHCAGRRTSALIFGKGVFADHHGPSPREPRPGNGAAGRGRDEPTPVPEALRGGHRPSRGEVMAACLELAGGHAVVATTGYTSRELYRLSDTGNHFYMAGSMGSAPGIAAGIAVAAGPPLLVLDGDGALLMRLGSLATVGRYVRSPFVHVVLDNGQHESTGGQRTNAAGVDFATAALACGYRAAWRCEGIDAARAGLARAVAVAAAGPVLVHCLIRPGVTGTLPRPAVSPAEVALRFRQHISQTIARALA